MLFQSRSIRPLAEAVGAWLLAAVLFGSTAGGCGEPADPAPSDVRSVSEDECLSGRKWVGGTSGDPKMHPGRECSECHHEERDDTSAFAVSGTVYRGFEETNDCAGVEGATVRIEGAEGGTVEVPTNAVGNFYLEESDFTLETPLETEVRFDGQSRNMKVELYDANCNSCHGSERTSARDPGRIVIPGIEPP